MERYCGIEPRGKRTVVFDSYARLQDVAIDPARVGFHAEEQYEQADFSFKRFDPDSSMEWVWGYSFLERRPVLIPKHLAYYSMSDGGGFVYETSNGCAVGESGGSDFVRDSRGRRAGLLPDDLVCKASGAATAA